MAKRPSCDPLLSNLQTTQFTLSFSIMVDTETKTGTASFVAALVAAGIGVAVLCGWAFQIDMLKSVLSGAVTMNPVTATALILAGTSLALSLRAQHWTNSASKVGLMFAARISALLVVMIGLGRLTATLFGCDIGVDQWLFPLQAASQYPLPSHIAPNAALNLLLIGSSLLVVDNKKQGTCFFVEIFMVVIGFGSLLAILGYVYDIQLFYRLGVYIPMAVHTATSFFILAVAVLLSHTDGGLLGVFAGDTAAGAMARRLLPAAIIVPAGLGWLTLRGENAGFYPQELGHAVFAVGNILVFTLLVGWSARGLFTAERARTKAEEAMRESEERFSGAFEYAPIGVALVSPEGLWLKVNQATCQLVGYSEAELQARTFQDITHPMDLANDLEQVHRILAGEIRSYQIEKRYIHRLGHIVNVLLSVSLVRDSQGRPRYFISQIQDITEQNRAQEELRWKTAFLEAQVNSSIDGVLVVGEQGKKILQNQRMADLWKIPSLIAEQNEDQNQVQWVAEQTKDPAQFMEKVRYLVSRPNEVIRDEISLKDGTVLDRYSSPVVGKSGQYYGRIWTFRDITERKRAEDVLRESDEKFNQLVNHITDAFWIRSPDMSVVHYISPAFERIWGRSVESLYANPAAWTSYLFPEDRERVLAAFSTLTGDAQGVDLQYRILRPGGEIRWVHVRGFKVRDGTGRLIRHIGIVSDITERKLIETQLFQSQKMEIIGKLVGGVAHEFNSILTVIAGQSELLLRDLPAGSIMESSAIEISRAAERAATLTRQLLAYGRKQILKPEILDLNRIIANMKGMFSHLMGREVEVNVVATGGLHSVKADPGQIEHVLMNMAINAREAMPHGGRFTLKTANVTVDPEHEGSYPGLKSGDYALITISDTGLGMSEQVKAHLFEPFFTTKRVGEGSGLGLSMCDGIIKQSGGHISAESEPGRGCAFKIYLPRIRSEMKPQARRIEFPDLPRGTECILLVESDPALREMAASFLRHLGYTVLTASDEMEYMSRHIPQGDIGSIDLLCTEALAVPVNSNELTASLKEINPSLRILVCAPYSESLFGTQSRLDHDVQYLQKPFAPSSLAHRIREMLDQRGTPQSHGSTEPDPFADPTQIGSQK